MKNLMVRLFPVLIIGFILTGYQSKPGRIVNSWKVGTYTGVFKEFSQDEFNNFKQSGIDYIEIAASVFGNKPDDACSALVQEIKRNADAAGIKIWSVHLPFGKNNDIATLDEKERAKIVKECIRIMNVCSPLKPEKFIVHGGAEPVADSNRIQRIEKAVSSLKTLSAEAIKVNGRIAVECLPRTCLGNTSEELLKLVNAAGDNVEICFDSNHLLKEKPEEFVAKAGKRITTVHISDYDGIDEKHWLPGTGVIDWNAVISELAKSGYSGPFMFEASRRKPTSEITTGTRITARELYTNFKKIKEEYFRSL